MSSKEGPFQLGPELETKRKWGLEIDQEKGSKGLKYYLPLKIQTFVASWMDLQLL